MLSYLCGGNGVRKMEKSEKIRKEENKESEADVRYLNQDVGFIVIEKKGKEVEEMQKVITPFGCAYLKTDEAVMAAKRIGVKAFYNYHQQYPMNVITIR